MATASQLPYQSPLPNGTGFSFGIVATRWNREIIDSLLHSCKDTLLSSGVESAAIHLVDVPGSIELPLAAKWMLENNAFLNGVICLGVVIRGETSHYDYVCKAATDGILQVMLETGKPVIFGVLTVENEQQAKDRAGGKLGNKGADAAIAALEMAELNRKLKR